MTFRWTLQLLAAYLQSFRHCQGKSVYAFDVLNGNDNWLCVKKKSAKMQVDTTKLAERERELSQREKAELVTENTLHNEVL